MALTIDPASVTIRWTTKGAIAGVKPGREHVVLHCTKDANLSAGDTVKPGKVNNANAVGIEAKVFVAADAGEFDLGDMKIGMAQVSTLNTYRVLYVGRLDTEGSSEIDILKGYTKNPSLDVELKPSETIDSHIFTSDQLTVSRATVQGRAGLAVTLNFGDHPHNTFPLTFENRITSAPNFLARVTRSESFIAYFIAREKAGTPIQILARLGWAISWDAEVNWTVKTARPDNRPEPLSATIIRSELFPGQPRIGAPPPDQESTIAINRATPATGDQDELAQQGAWINRNTAICTQNRTRPAGFRPNFFI